MMQPISIVRISGRSRPLSSSHYYRIIAETNSGDLLAGSETKVKPKAISR